MIKKGYIYKYTFPNGKVYIGQTAQNLEERHYQHLYNADHIDAEDRSILLVDRAIHKYGVPKLEVIDEIECNDNEIVKFQEELNEQGVLLIDGYPEEHQAFYETKLDEDAQITFPYTVEEGKVFVMNDYRLEKKDSDSAGDSHCGYYRYYRGCFC